MGSKAFQKGQPTEKAIIKETNAPDKDQLYQDYIIKEHGLKSQNHLYEEKKKEYWMYNPMEQENAWRE